MNILNFFFFVKCNRAESTGAGDRIMTNWKRLSYNKQGSCTAAKTKSSPHTLN